MFPPEIVDAIVDNIAASTDDVLDDALAILPTLLAFSLTSKEFAAAARRRLFSTITISPYKQHTPTFMERRSKEEIVHRGSDLTLEIQRLNIVVDTEGHILAEDSRLGNLFNILTRRALSLRSLCVERLQFYRGSDLSWTEFPAKTATIFANLLKEGHISTLKLIGVIDIPSSLVTRTQFPHLTSLDLQGSKFSVTAGGDTDDLDVPASLPEIGSYRMSYGSDGRPILTALHARLFNSGDANQLHRLLRDKLAASLETFGCFVTDLQAQSLPIIANDLGELSQLRNVLVKLYASPPNINTAIAKLRDVATQGSKLLSLEEITLSVYSGTDLRRLHEVLHFDYSPLKSLRLYSLRGKYPSIRRATFILSIESNSGPSAPRGHLENLENQIRGHILDAIKENDPGTSHSLPDLRVHITCHSY